MPSESPPVEQVSPSPFASDDRIYDDGRLITDDGIGIFTYFVNLHLSFDGRVRCLRW